MNGIITFTELVQIAVVSFALGAAAMLFGLSMLVKRG